jgi:2-iminobutanoate/2-iminopropanoate deaminase
MQLVLNFACCLVLFVPLAVAQKKVIVPEELAGAGQAAAMFSPGILDGGTLYLSGQLGRDLKTNKIPDNFEAEVRACLENIQLILKAANMDFADLNSVQIFLTDMTLFPRMNAVYSALIKAPRPARATVGVAALAVKDAHIEISAIASVGSRSR